MTLVISPSVRAHRQAVMGFAAGLLLGAALMVPAIGRRVDELLLERDRLAAQVVTLETRVQKLSDTLEKLNTARSGSARPTVKGIRLHADLPDSPDRVRLEERLNGMLKELLGRPLATLDPVLLYLVLHDRSLFIGEKTFRVHVRALLLAEEVHVYYTAQEVRPAPSP